MKRVLISAMVMALGFGGTSMLGGCDREDTIKYEKKTETSDGKTVNKEEKVTKDKDTGTVTKTETKDVKTKTD